MLKIIPGVCEISKKNENIDDLDDININDKVIKKKMEDYEQRTVIC